MRRGWMCSAVVGLCVTMPAGVAAGQQAGNPPGQPTPARVQVGNRGPDEAVPVVVQSGSEVQPVAVISAPVLSLAANTHVSTEARAQRWEYRLISAKAGEDIMPALDKAGLDGWEAVGVLPVAASPELRVLLKRPR